MEARDGIGKKGHIKVGLVGRVGDWKDGSEETLRGKEGKRGNEECRSKSWRWDEEIGKIEEINVNK